MGSLALLLIRGVLGGFVAGHGAQKLFGWFGGYGLEGTGGFMESLGLKPGKQWAALGGASEFGGGVLMLLGLLNPLGSLGIIGAMSMATAKVHWNNPIWETEGGAEFPVTNMAAATALMLTGPGKLSFDHALGIRLPRWIAPLGLATILLIVAYANQQEAPPQEPPQEGPPEERNE